MNKRSLLTAPRFLALGALLAAIGAVAACSAPSETEEDALDLTNDDREKGRAAEDGALEADVAAALSAFGDVEVLAVRRGVPTFIRGSLGEVAAPVTESDAPLKDTLHKVAPVFRVSESDLVLEGATADALGATHVRYQQTKDAIPVVGGDLVVHLDPAGLVYSVTGTARDGVARIKAALTAAQATAKAAAAIGAGAVTQAARLVYFRPETADMQLTWEVRGQLGDDPFTDELVYVDAVDGSIVDRHPQTHAALARSIHTLDQQVAKTTKDLPGALLRSEGGKPSADPIGNESYDMMGATWECFSKLFRRDSYDGKGGKLVSSVHARFSGANGATHPNQAAWLGQARQMVYGDGDGQKFGNLARSFDVTVHEVGHGITSSEAKLVYRGESGALNEAMSDVFGTLCDAQRGAPAASVWALGEEVFTPGTAGDALRYIDDPAKDGKSRDFYGDRYTGTADNGGVHANSGIGNLAFALLAKGGTHPRKKSAVSVPALGLAKAGTIFYRALTSYMTSQSDFRGARAATAQSARELYGAAAEDAVHLAWDAVGVPRPDPKAPAPKPAEGGAPAPKPATDAGAPAPKPTSGYGCCLNDRCYSCPDKAAMNRCVGFDVKACTDRCSGELSCFIDCKVQAATAKHDPSACTPR